MPVATRTLDYARQQVDGNFNCRVTLVDTKGRVHTVGPFVTTSLAAAQTIRDTYTPDLAAAEETDVITFIADGNDPDTYPLEEMTQAEMRRRVVRKLATQEINVGDKAFVCRVAAYITQFTATQISNFLGITLQQAQTILDRALRLDTVICPALDADAADRQENI